MKQTLNVQFADETNAVITSYFGSPQDPAIYPNQGTVESDDPRWMPFCEAVPSIARAGLPAIDG
jgi:hypothetical protein